MKNSVTVLTVFTQVEKENGAFEYHLQGIIRKTVSQVSYRSLEENGYTYSW